MAHLIHTCTHCNQIIELNDDYSVIKNKYYHHECVSKVNYQKQNIVQDEMHNNPHVIVTKGNILSIQPTEEEKKSNYNDDRQSIHSNRVNSMSSITYIPF